MEIEILDLKKQIEEILDKVYPVGSIYTTVNENFNPKTLGFPGTWEKFGTDTETNQGRFLIAPNRPNEKGQLEQTGGSMNHFHSYSVSYYTTKWVLSEARATQGVPNKDATTSITETGQSYNTNSALGNGSAWDYGDGDRHVSTGQTGTTSTLPPYITVQFWKRVS